MIKVIKKILILSILGILILSCLSNETNKELVYNIASAPRSLDPHKYSDTISLQISNSLYDGLLRLNDKGEIVGALAESYEKINNKYIFTLRKNVKYSDGSEIKIEDLRNAFLRVLDKDNLSQFSSMLFIIKGAKEYYETKDENVLGIVIEDSKLVIELKEDVSYFPYLMTLPLSVPYKEGLYTGAFKIENHLEQELLLSKNENYWRENEVKLEKVKYIYFNDFSTINNLINNNDIDISRVDVEMFKEKVNSYFDGRIWYLDYNVYTNENLKNIHLRNAISLAIDREQYVNVIKNDGSKKALNLISDIFSYEADYYIDDFNLEKAKLELEMAKKELSIDKISLELLSGNTPIEIKEIQYIQEQLRKNLEIDVTVKTVPYKDRLSLIKENNYDIALNTYSAKYKDAISILDRFYGKAKKTDVFSQDEYRKLIDESRLDSSDRMIKIQKAEKMLLENMFVSPLYFSIENQYISSRVKNVINHPIGNITDISYIYLEK